MKMFLLILLNLPVCVIAHDMQNVKKALEKTSIQGLPEWETAFGPFDAKKAQIQMKSGIQAHESEMGNWVLEASHNRLPANDLYQVNIALDQVEAQTGNLENSLQKGRAGITTHKCLESQTPELIVLIRELEIEVNYSPKKIKHKRICLGHTRMKECSSKKKAKKKDKKWTGHFKRDRSIARYTIDWKGSFINGYEVITTYKHRADASNCHHFKTVKKVAHKEIKEIVREQWVDRNGNYKELLQDPDVTFVQKQCVDTTSAKTINHLLIERPCWKEQLLFLKKRTLNHTADCDMYRSQNCSLIQAKCIDGQEHNCGL